jgi:hypothetical protein
VPGEPLSSVPDRGQCTFVGDRSCSAPAATCPCAPRGMSHGSESHVAKHAHHGLPAVVPRTLYLDLPSQVGQDLYPSSV